MKRLLSILFCAGILAGCSKSFGPYRPSTEDADPEPQTFQAIVTVKQDDSGTLFFRSTTDFPNFVLSDVAKSMIVLPARS